MNSSRSPRRELLDIWAKHDKGKGAVLFPPDLSSKGGPPPHLFKAYRRLWLDFQGNSFYLDGILKKGWQHTPRSWRRLLSLAFSELQWAQPKDLHGVVYDWVEQSRNVLGEKAVKVINGTLRRANRDLESGEAPRSGLPENLQELMGADARHHLNLPQSLFGFPLDEANPDQQLPEGVLPLSHPNLGTIHKLEPGTSPQTWASETEGFIQNLSAAEVAAKVKSRFSGTDFLDFCAAPGGKSWQLIRLGLKSISYHDASPARLDAMEKSSLGVKLAERTSRLNKDDNPLFDGILIDVPCSNSGVLSKCPEAVRHYWPPATSFQEVQEEVFLDALNYLKPNGQLFYSTCSVDPVENEGRTHQLASRYGLELVYEKHWSEFDEGRHGAYLAELRNCE